MKIPGYRIEREIGQGGMATIYLAVQESLNRSVALKVMAPSLTANPTFSERFLREAHTVGQLNHPHIVAVYDVGMVDHNHYIAMEYVDGGDLKQRQKSGEISVDEALTIISQIASALGYAHEKGFVHRDIKPENILFREDGSAVLSDFGIAKAVDSATRMTGTGMSIGTPHYMSPEQAQGKEELDVRSDLYSLGIVFYEMLTGKVPYEADNTIGVAMQHVQAPIPELPSNLSKYQPLLDRLLAKQAGQRYQSATGLIKAIEQLQSGARLQRPVHATRVMTSTEVVSPNTVRDISPQKSGLKRALGGILLMVIIGFLIDAVMRSQVSVNSTNISSTQSNGSPAGIEAIELQKQAELEAQRNREAEEEARRQAELEAQRKREAEEEARRQAELQNTARFEITNTTNDKINVVFFDRDSRRRHDPASDNLTYTLNGNATKTFRVDCTPDQQVCYGAWKRGSVLNPSWGVGYSGDQSCSRCCLRCSGTASYTFNDNDSRMPTPTLTWRVVDNTHQTVRMAFYSDTRPGHVWPNVNRHWVLNAGENKIKISCLAKEKICYGAWTDANSYWGVGKGNRYSCKGCCRLCNGQVTDRIGLKD